mgnify:CR=1 FL=1
MWSFADENMKQVADVILPIGLASEVAGSFFNNFATAQSFGPAAQLPGDTKPGWRVLRVLANMLNIDDFDFQAPTLELSSSILEADGKRGNVSLKFVVNANGKTVGHGEKNIVLSGLREYDQEKIDVLVKDYNGRKES